MQRTAEKAQLWFSHFPPARWLHRGPRVTDTTCKQTLCPMQGAFSHAMDGILQHAVFYSSLVKHTL